MSIMYRSSSFAIPVLLCNSALWHTAFTLCMCRCKLKSLDTTDTFSKILRLSSGNISILESTKITIDSTPEVVKGNTDSYAATSDGLPLAVALAPPLAAGAGLAGAFAVLAGALFFASLDAYI